jgi:hypothetical protein
LGLLRFCRRGCVSSIHGFTVCSANSTEIYHGLGRPNETLGARDIRASLRALYIVIPFYNLSLTLTKLSMAVLYMRVFPTPSILLALRLLLAAIAVIGLWMVLSSFLFCIPVEAFWETRISTRECLPQQVWYLNAALQITTDVVIVVFPMPVLGRLRVSKRERAAMVVVFGVGVLYPPPFPFTHYPPGLAGAGANDDDDGVVSAS